MAINVLVCDDVANFRLLTKKVLTEDGYFVHTAADGHEALEMINNRPDIQLLVLDIKLPDINGLEVLGRVRIKNKTLPVIMISGYTSTESILQAKKLGIQGFFTKPINWDQFREKVKEILKNAK